MLIRMKDLIQFFYLISSTASSYERFNKKNYLIDSTVKASAANAYEHA
jgi:hypothetical protein